MKKRIKLIKSDLKRLGVVMSLTIPFIYIESGTYIRVLYMNSVEIIQTGQSFNLSYDSLSKKVLDMIIDTLEQKMIKP